jgi:hypothetical protein
VTQSRLAPRRRRDPRVRRRSIVYGFNILDPDSGKVLVDYVGQTVQELEARERQHRGQDFTVDDTEQPWSDLIVGKPFILDEGMWTAVELDVREEFHIRRLRPRYNYTHNLDNPDRIPIPVARRRREERDRVAGRVSPSWAGRAPQPAAGVLAVMWGEIRSWSTGQRRLAALAMFWLLFAAVLWVTVWSRLPGTMGGLAAVAGSAVPTLVGTFHGWGRRRRSRRRRR